jgi:serine/threonine protein kinase
LGKGGMGAVYKARQPAVQRMIALKVLLQEFAENETVIRRFHQEALAASRLEHPNTIRVYDFGQTDDGILFIAMEYLRGQSLAQSQARGRGMSAKRVVHIMRQVCKSLSEAHKAGIIHRDLKPDNIFLVEIEGERDFAKVLDFGVAKLKEFEGNEGTLTQAGMIFGTPKYMSPEQARSGNLDPRSDVYALGVILYEMLTGRAPFVGENPLSILIAHVNEQPPPFHEVNPKVDIPPALEAVVFKALAKNREHRHASVDELLTELEAVDKLLDGASYESVAAALPGIIPGADGSPSLVGPAILPQGSDETQRGVEQRSGDTVRLDGEGNPVLVPIAEQHLQVDAPEERSGGSKTPIIAILLALPILGLGAWFFTQNGDDPVNPKPQPGSTASAASNAPKVNTPSLPSSAAPSTQVAAVTSDGPGSQAPQTAASAAPSTVTFKIRTKQKNVQIKDLVTNEVLGTTPELVEFAGPRTLILSKTGYYTRRVTVDPANGEPKEPFKLKAKPVAEPVKPVAPKTEARKVVVRKTQPRVKVKPAAVPTEADIDLDLQ